MFTASCYGQAPDSTNCSINCYSAKTNIHPTKGIHQGISRRPASGDIHHRTSPVNDCILCHTPTGDRHPTSPVKYCIACRTTIENMYASANKISLTDRHAIRYATTGDMH